MSSEERLVSDPGTSRSAALATRPTTLERPAAAPTAPVRRRPSTLSWRGVLTGAILLWPNAYWLNQMEIIRGSAHPTTISLFFNCVFLLLVVTLANRAIASFRPRWALSRADLLMVYSMLAIGSCIAGHDSLEVLVPMLSWPWRFASVSNGWEARWFQYLPAWLMMPDKKAMEGYYIGNSTLYTREHLLAWVRPVLLWTAFVVVLLFVMQCINVILRKQWTERERLSYPIIQLPLELTAGADEGRLSPLFSQRLFWFGFVFAGVVDLINGLNLYYPWVPAILAPGFGRSYLDLRPYFPDKPWNAMGWTPVSWYPFMIGLGMLLPLDFLFSAWFFFLYWKALAIVTVMLAYDSDPRAPYTNMQAFGAYIAFVATSVWLSRGYLRQVWRRIWGRPSELDDRDEPLGYRAAALGIVGGMLALTAFSAAMGMPWWIGLAFFTIYLALALAITRMRAELGTPVHDLHFTGPDWVLSEVVGTRSFSPPTLAAFSLYFWFNRAYRSQAMPHQLEGFKLADVTRTSQRQWFGVLMLAAALGALAGFWAMLHLNYHYGATAKAGTFGPEAYRRLDGWIQTPHLPSSRALLAIIAGFLIALFLQVMRTRLPWWPFHPLGFAVTSSWEINLVWMPLFIAWVLKLVILRYGGRQGFGKSIPFFMGLIMGQFVVGSLWNIYGIATDLPTYQFWE
jgi:hypothetical protein